MTAQDSIKQNNEFLDLPKLLIRKDSIIAVQIVSGFAAGYEVSSSHDGEKWIRIATTPTNSPDKIVIECEDEGTARSTLREIKRMLDQ